ncbi:hypothetical protein HDU85_001360 [Gaertneriomyces sp. JEL0708]|nr:hypothetical protein HDU85_001360 [Gaertneriomyces sp. JEL0708]
MSGGDQSSLSLATLSIHADTATTPDIAPPMHMTSTYRYPSYYNDRAAVEKGWIPPPEIPSYPSELREGLTDGSPHIYSRISATTNVRVEAVLGALEGGHAVTYASGLAAVFAAFQYYQPNRVVLSKSGYFGSHGAIQVYLRGRSNVEVAYLDDYEHLDTVQLKEGDLIWLESPQNPRGEVVDVKALALRKPQNCTLAIDATFAPPPIQRCLALGADMVMHSSTKFLGGHSDLLGGVLAVKDPLIAEKLREDRMFLGSVMGSMEQWLLLRSLRSLTVRVTQQARTATALASWLNARDEEATSIVERVWHGSIEGTPGHEVAKRLGNGLYSGVMSIEFSSPHYARLLPRSLHIIANATSLGGCESLLEWRAAIDDKVSPKLVRFSVGLEDLEDLKNDLRHAFLKIKADVEVKVNQGVWKFAEKVGI